MSIDYTAQNNHAPYRMIVIGASHGGTEAISLFLANLPAEFTAPICIVQHVYKSGGRHLPTILSSSCSLHFPEVVDKIAIENGHVYIAPAGYHMLIDSEDTISLSIDAPVSYVRPSIDVLFSSAACVYRQHLIGVLLTGTNSDGSAGLQDIHDHGGVTLVQDPNTAIADTMPREAIRRAKVDHVLDIEKIAQYCAKLTNYDDLPSPLGPVSNENRYFSG